MYVALYNNPSYPRIFIGCHLDDLLEDRRTIDIIITKIFLQSVF